MRDAATRGSHVFLVHSSLQFLLATALAAEQHQRTRQPCRLLFLPALAALPYDRWPTVLQEAIQWGLLEPHEQWEGYLRLQPIFPYFLKTRLAASSPPNPPEGGISPFSPPFGGAGGFQG